MTEAKKEIYMKTFNHRHNELVIAWYNFLCVLFADWHWAYRQVLKLRTEAARKSEQDYHDYCELFDDDE